MKQRYRLVAYASNGAPLGSLSHPSEYKLGPGYNDLPNMSLSYSDKMPNADRLYSPCEVGVEYSLDGETWTEMPNGRYLRIKRGRELVGDSKIRSYTMPGYGHLLRKAKQLQITGLNADGKRVLDGTLGKIIKTLVDENKAAGGSLVGMSYDFTATTDSNGDPWAKSITDLGFEPGLDYFTILFNLADMGLGDWHFQGRTLRMFNPSYLEVTKPVTLRPGVDLKALPVEGDLDEMIHTALVVGDGGVKLNATSGYAPPVYWGKWQDYITASGVTDPTTLSALAVQRFARGAGEQSQLTAELQVGKTQWEPFAHFIPGNYIVGPKEVAAGADPATDRYRVRQINIDRGTDGKVKVDLVVNDRFAEAEIKRARKLSSLTGGATIGGTGTSPTLPPSAGRVPATPAGLVASSIGAPNEAGFYRNTITVNWADVGVDVQGNGLIVDGYDLQAYLGTEAEPTYSARLAQSYYQILSRAPLETWNIRVRAVSSTGTVSAWTNPMVVVVTESDTTPPPIPTLPTTSSALGTATVRWDGRAAGGGTMPPDFDHVRVWQQGATAFIGRVEKGGGYVGVGGLTPGQQYLFQLSAVDKSGNESARTDLVPITVVSAATDAGIQAELEAIQADLEAGVETSVQVAADGISRVIYSNGPPVGQYPSGSTWYQRNSAQEIIGQWEFVGGAVHPDWYLDSYNYDEAASSEKYLDGYEYVGITGSWVSKILANAVLANLDAGKITFGELDGLRIKAGTIRTDRLTVGLAQNSLPDPLFLNSTVIAGRTGSGWAYDGTARAFVNTTTPTQRLSLASAGALTPYFNLIQVSPGERYYVVATVTSSIANQVAFTMEGFDLAGVSQGITSTADITVLATATTTASAVWTVPAGVYLVNPGIVFRSASAATNTIRLPAMTRQASAVTIADGAVTAAKVAAGAITANSIAVGSLDGFVITAPTIRTAIVGNRTEFTNQGIRLFKGTTLKAWWSSAFGQLRIYSTGDLTHTSTGHGFQIGDDDQQNLAIDDNEVMSRNAGDFGQLLLNREGGQVLIGGIKGGMNPDPLNRSYPEDGNHSVNLRGYVTISNTTDGGYADEFPPLLIGAAGGQHLWFDNNEFGSSSGDGPNGLVINPPREAPNSAGDIHHLSPIALSSNSLGIKRFGIYSSGTRSALIYGYDSGNDTAIRFSGALDAVLVVDSAGDNYKAIRASAFTVVSEQAAKHSIGPIDDVLELVRRAPAKRWQYNADVEAADQWHFGPMYEDLPPEILRPAVMEGGVRQPGAVDQGSMLGIMWEALRVLIEERARG